MAFLLAAEQITSMPRSVVRAHDGAKKGIAPKNVSVAPAETTKYATFALGNPTGFHLSHGQAHDLQGADVLKNRSDQGPASGKTQQEQGFAWSSTRWKTIPKSNQKDHWEFDQDKLAAHD